LCLSEKIVAYEGTEAWVQEINELENTQLKRHNKRDYLAICMALQASVVQDVQFSGLCESCFVDIWSDFFHRRWAFMWLVARQDNTNKKCRCTSMFQMGLKLTI
jgi:hypothetical protein